MVKTEGKKQEDIDQLVQDFYQVKHDISLVGYQSTNKSRAFSERKHSIMWQLKQELEKVSKTKGDKIRKKLWDELGVVI